MLAMKKSCELCGTSIVADGRAYICSYECTYCESCNARLDECPNCAGDLQPRPTRTSGVSEISARLPQRIRRRIGTRRPGR